MLTGKGLLADRAVLDEPTSHLDEAVTDLAGDDRRP